jgi:hypothetical protein
MVKRGRDEGLLVNFCDNTPTRDEFPEDGESNVFTLCGA